MGDDCSIEELDGKKGDGCSICAWKRVVYTSGNRLNDFT